MCGILNTSKRICGKRKWLAASFRFALSLLPKQKLNSLCRYQIRAAQTHMASNTASMSRLCLHILKVLPPIRGQHLLKATQLTSLAMTRITRLPNIQPRLQTPTKLLDAGPQGGRLDCSTAVATLMGDVSFICPLHHISETRSFSYLKSVMCRDRAPRKVIGHAHGHGLMWSL